MIRYDEFEIKGRHIQVGRSCITWPVNGVTLVRVDSLSPKSHRKAVYEFARYFRMEEGYDFTQYGYDGEEDDPTCRAYLFVAKDSHRSGVAFGAACFRERDGLNGGRWQELCWVWIHPFNRKRGCLKSALPVFRMEHGNFFPDTPWSPAMQQFVKSYMPDTYAMVSARMGGKK